MLCCEVSLLLSNSLRVVSFASGRRFAERAGRHPQNEDHRQGPRATHQDAGGAPCAAREVKKTGSDSLRVRPAQCV